MFSENSKNNANQDFVIENNIVKGVRKEVSIKTYDAGQIILKVFCDKPSHVAQIEAKTGKQTTYQNMKENTIRCALWMQKQGTRSGDVIAVCTHNQEDAYIPCLATFYVGAIFNPWHHEVSIKTARYLMNLTRPKIIFSCESAVNVLREAAKLEKVDMKIIVFGKYTGIDSLKDVMRLQTNEEVQIFQPRKSDDPESIALILFSSGTTGLPKGVAHSYKTLVRIFVTFTYIPANQISLWYSSLYWISGTLCMMQSILAGATRIVDENFDTEETCKIIEKFKVTWLFLAPSLITHWCKSSMLKKYKLKSLNKVLTGGAKLSREVLQEFKNSLPHTDISQGYGMTELGGVCTIQTDKCTKVESIGFVAENLELKVIDVNTGAILGPNQAGELCVKTPTLMIGYYKNPIATKETIDNEGWLHTGDKCYFAENGEFFIIDRLKEVMKFRGHQISAFEIEEILLTHPDVMDAAVVPVPHELDLERPMAFIKRVPGAKVTEEELVRLSSELGNCKKLWGGVKFLENIPYTASGKVNKKDLKEMAKAYTKT